MKFSELHLEPTLLQSIHDMNYDDCTPIQEKAIPFILEGKDISGLAQTGTGKTAAFLIPLMDRILKSKASIADTKTKPFESWEKNNFVLVLVPTRELADQVHENVNKLGRASGFRSFAIYGGVGYERQEEAFKLGYEFIIATPGRLLDLYKDHVVDLKQVRAVVFDEADRMFDMGFKDEMKFILRRTPPQRQLMVFSATLNFDVLNTVYQFGAEPIEINISRDQAKATNVKDVLFHLGQNEKPAYLLSILKKYNPKQAIIFTNFKNSVDNIAHFLNKNGFPAVAISSLLTQVQRTRVLQQFKSDNPKNILVATDVAARGLDVLGVDLVINFELPGDPETYVHRIGRTGRAQHEGLAFSLSSDKDVDALQRIESYLKTKLTLGWLEDSEIMKEFASWKEEEPKPYERSYDQTSNYPHSRPFHNRSHNRSQRKEHPGKRSYEKRSFEKNTSEQSSKGETGRVSPQNRYRSQDRNQDRNQERSRPSGEPQSRGRFKSQTSTHAKTSYQHQSQSQVQSQAQTQTQAQAQHHRGTPSKSSQHSRSSAPSHSHHHNKSSQSHQHSSSSSKSHHLKTSEATASNKATSGANWVSKVKGVVSGWFKKRK